MKTMKKEAIMPRMILITLCMLIFTVSQSFAIEQVTLSGLGAGKRMKAELILPDGKGPFPAVLVLHTSGNMEGADIIFAKKLSREGFACLVPYYFDAYDISYNGRKQAFGKYAEPILEDFISEIEFLRSDGRVKASKVGAVGFSMGGYWSLVLAAKGEVQAGVSYYGAMTGTGRNMRFPLEKMFTKASLPVLILHGALDDTIPVASAEEVVKAVEQSHTPYEVRIYDGAEHRFDRNTKMHRQQSMRGPGDTFDVEVTKDSWNRTLNFFNKYLK